MIKKILHEHTILLAAYAFLFIFLMYTCAYAFSKPFTAGLYNGETLFGFDAKVVFVLEEIIGYACSNFIGVRILSEISLIGFAVLPPPVQGC